MLPAMTESHQQYYGVWLFIISFIAGLECTLTKSTYTEMFQIRAAVCNLQQTTSQTTTRSNSNDILCQATPLFTLFSVTRTNESTKVHNPQRDS